VEQPRAKIPTSQQRILMFIMLLLFVILLVFILLLLPPANRGEE
jgi:hypothetical protein